MLKNKPNFEVYTDGSVTYDATKIGIAWVIATHDVTSPRVLAAKLRPLKKPKNIRKTDQDLGQKRRRLAMRAEFLAVCSALRTLPANSNVKIFTDHKEVARAIADPDAWLSAINNKYIERKKLKKTLNILIKSLERHQNVESEWVSDKTSDPEIKQNMILAHNAACRASGSKNTKAEQPIQTNEEMLDTGPIAWPPRLGQ